MGPDAELGVAEPGRETVGLERRGGSFEGAVRDGDLALLGVGGAEGGSCGGEESDGLATCDAHGWRVILLRRFVYWVNVVIRWRRCKVKAWRLLLRAGLRVVFREVNVMEDCSMVEMPMIAKGAEELYLLPGMSNRHGLVAGATGTGKTVTLQVMAEALSSIGVPVFAADVKGDLSGISQAGKSSTKFDARVKALGLGDWSFAGCPVVFWDVFGKQGHPVRATVSEMGPLLLSRILNLNDTQTGVLTLVFKIADDSGLLLLDMKDLQAMLQHVGENAKEYQTQYGNISAASIGAIQRGLVALGQQGGDLFFGEPALNIEDLLQVDSKRHGVVNILAADQLMQSPQLYATFLLWLMSELFEKLPEVGDQEKPKLVFFFDEAHLLFNDLPSVLQNRIEQVVRLIRSKGVGVFFVTQNPIDVPDTVLSQLGNRVQHALRAFSPRDQKAVKAAAQTFRANPKLNVEAVITELGVGEALVSFLDEKGIPGWWSGRW